MAASLPVRVGLTSMMMKPSTAWLFLFLPALSYYVTTRLHSIGLFRSSTYGTVIDTKLSGIPCAATDDDHVLYTTHDCSQLKYPVYLVDEDFQDIVATTWKHDEELGRGYLLLSTSFQQGKVWQWETGGGPIAIGRTLHLKDSGCRSDFYRNCTSSGQQFGSGGIVVDTWHDPPRLIVAEWGEGRIARLEENGARTPMVMQLPETLHGLNDYSDYPPRVQNPFKLLLSPWGDLMLLDTFGSEDCLLRLPQAATGTPALGSLAVSRRAHSWERINTTQLPQILLHSTHLGGIALEPNQWLRMYVTMKQNNLVVVVRLSLEEEGDEEGHSGQQPRQSTILLDYTAYTSEPRAIEVDEKGNLYLVVDDGILLAASSGEILGKVTISDGPIVDLTLGEDKFLYMATSTKLMRMRVRHGQLAIPTNLLLKN
jgi:hypothetical protein